MEANDPTRTSYALSLMSLTAMRRNDFGRAGDLNDAATRDTGGDLGRLTWVLYQGAQIFGGANNRSAAYQRLNRAERLTERIQPRNVSLYWMTPEVFRCQHAYTLGKLGEPQSIDLMAEALTTLPEEWRNAEWTQPWREFLSA